MKAIKKKDSNEVRLTLSQEEALWLRAVMQNPMPAGDGYTGDPNDEDPYNRDMRKKFFEAAQAVDYEFRQSVEYYSNDTSKTTIELL